MNIQVSVIIPLFNTRTWVNQAVVSVLAQKKILFECIVVDDGSTDGGGEMLKERFGKRITVIRQSNKGVSSARNRGVDASHGKYLAFLDADDYWASSKLLCQVSYMKAHPGIAAVYCQAFRVNSNGKLILRKPFGLGTQDDDFLLENILSKQKPPALGSTMMIKADAFRRMNGFDPKIFIGEDLDFQLKMARKEQSQHMIARPLAFIRYLEHSISHSLKEEHWMKTYRSRLNIYEKLLADTTTSGINSLLVERRIFYIHLRQLLFLTYIKEDGAAGKIRDLVESMYEKLSKDSKDFYIQIEYFTPLIFINKGLQALKDFVGLVLVERDRLAPNQKNLRRDELAKINAAVWCAGQGGYKESISAWNMLLNACWEDLYIMLSPDFWKQAARLLFGNLVLWIIKRK